MNPRWLIPGSLAAFAVVAAALWAWLSHTQQQVVIERVMLDELAVLSAQRRSAGDAMAPSATSAAQNRDAAPIALADATPPPRAGRPVRRSRVVSPRPPNWSQLAERLDDRLALMRTRTRDASFVRSSAGWAHLDADRPLAALHEFDRVLDRLPGDAAALAGRSDALCRLGRHDEAIAAAQRWTRADPAEPAARYNLGVLLYRMSRFTEAAAEFRELVVLAPGHARGWFNLAGLAQRAGRLTEARDAWRRFTALEPNVAAGWFNLGIVQLDLDAPFEALFCLASATAIDPDDVDTRINMAAVFESLGDPAAADEIIEDVRRRRPCEPALLAWLPDDSSIAAVGPPVAHEPPAADGPPVAADPSAQSPDQTASLHTEGDGG